MSAYAEIPNWPWAPFYEGEGPISIHGYDGRLHPERATPGEWRRFWMGEATRGGCDCIENIQPLCQPCNSSKSNREWQ